MNYYETLYIVHPALDAGRLKDIIMGVEDSLKKKGGDPLAVELWGKRKLAYFIDKQKYGTYVLVQYNGEGKCTGDFAVELEHNPNILAYLTTSIEKDKVIKQEEDIETQIAGKTREAERSEARKETTIPKTENKESDTAEIKKEDESSDDKSVKTDAVVKEKDADATENEPETTESEDKENDSTEDESTEETNDSEVDKDVDSPTEKNSEVQVTDEESSVEIAESEPDEENTTSEKSMEKESETKQEKAEDEPTVVSKEE